MAVFLICRGILITVIKILDIKADGLTILRYRDTQCFFHGVRLCLTALDATGGVGQNVESFLRYFLTAKFTKYFFPQGTPLRS